MCIGSFNGEGTDSHLAAPPKPAHAVTDAPWLRLDRRRGPGVTGKATAISTPPRRIAYTCVQQPRMTTD